jgi:hypothetical protein
MNKALFVRLLAVAAAASVGRSQTLLRTFTGTVPNASLGYSLANCGDLDGDGVCELAMGAPSGGSGRVRVVSAATGASIHDFVYPISNVPQSYGVALANAGDVDGDGLEDLLIGASASTSNWTVTAFVEVRSGASGAVLRTIQGPQDSRFGDELEALGDWDGDGRAEFVVAAAYADFNGTNSGRVYVFSGDPAASAPLYTIDGPGESDYYGNDAAAAGDVDADGVPDFMASYIGYDAGGFERIGRVEIFSGANGALLRAFDGPGYSFSSFGRTIANAGDLDGDGHADTLIAAPSDDGVPPHAGFVRLHSGADGALVHEWFGSTGSVYLGTKMGVLGDIDGDGQTDLALTGSKEVQIIAGSDFAPFLAFGGGPNAYSGSAVCALGDIDGDGIDDFALSDPSFNGSCGRVRLYAGSAERVISYCTAGTTTNGCTPQLTFSGTPSASAATPFSLSAPGLEGNKVGFVIYGVSGAQAAPWATNVHLLCVRSPLQRTPLVNPGGTNGQCDGVLVFDWNAYTQSHPSSLGQPFQSGDRVWAQGWFRDPASTKTTSLTDALAFQLAP